MTSCGQCNKPLDPEDRFCSFCGASVSGQPPVWGNRPPPVEPEPPPKPSPPKPKIKGRRLLLGLGLNVVVGIGIFFFVGRGCSSVEGKMVSTGKPLGDWTFTPTQCKSLDRRNVFGVVILPKKFNLGGIKVTRDEARERWVVKAELPGTCPSVEADCKVVTIDSSKCSVFKAYAKYTNTTVNRVRLMDGYLKLDCRFSDGTTKADITFKSCD